MVHWLESNTHLEASNINVSVINVTYTNSKACFHLTWTLLKGYYVGYYVVIVSGYRNVKMQSVLVLHMPREALCSNEIILIYFIILSSQERTLIGECWWHWHYFQIYCLLCHKLDVCKPEFAIGSFLFFVNFHIR